MDDAGRADRREMHEASLLLRRILTLNDEVEKQLAEELDVNPTDFDAMQHLIQSGPLSPSEIAARLGITTAAATMAVDRLVKVGHVTRQPHPSDRRRLLVVPREESVRRAMARLLPMIGETDALLSRYTDAEQAAITDYLARTVQILQRTLGRDGA
ncbi:MarR family transcriptional regulator [Cryobacterium tepidiphilum]|nr:MarR family transcriptional regulator [Cryobacterium tepidiphilum]